MHTKNNENTCFLVEFYAFFFRYILTFDAKNNNLKIFTKLTGIIYLMKA
jgi:hypothetical protein